MKTNFRLGVLGLLSIFASITSCKKDLGSSEKLNMDEQPSTLDRSKEITATYSSKYFDTVSNLIRQRKNYASFQNIPGWSIINPGLKSESSSQLYRTSESESEAFIESEVGTFEEPTDYSNFWLADNGNNIREWQYLPGYYPGAEQVIFGDWSFSNVLLVGDPTMSWMYNPVPKPHNMVVYKTRRFDTRQVWMEVELPFLYIKYLKDQSGVRSFKYAMLDNYRGTFHLTGTKMGEINESSKYFSFILDKDGYGEFSGGEVSEKRTLIVSTTGSSKVSTSINLEGFQAGVEIEEGFTISSASHTYSYYSCQGTIVLDKESYFNQPDCQINWTSRMFGLQIE